MGKDLLITPVYQDVPQSFLFEDSQGKIRLVGSYGKMMEHFAKYHNYSLVLARSSNILVSRIHWAIERGIFNLSMQPGTYHSRFANITFSYPVEWSRTCIMVPAEEELPRYWYLVWPFGPYIWLILHICIIYVALFMGYLKHPTMRFSNNLFKSLAVVLYSPNMNLKLVNVSLRIQLFYMILFLMGFIISSYYNCYLTVYNMRPVFQPFLRTEEDILRTNIAVLVPSHILEGLSKSPFSNLSKIQPSLVEKSQQEVTNNLRHYQRSFAYVVTRNEWAFMKKLQRNLIQPVYQLSDVCFGDILNAFPMRLQSKFSSALNRFILQVQQSGLWEHWQEEAFTSAIYAKYYWQLLDEYPVDPLNLYYFRLAWIIYAIGMTASGVCFAMECMYCKLKK